MQNREPSQKQESEMPYIHINSFFSVYPDTIKDGEIVIGYKRWGTGRRITFPNDFGVGYPCRDRKGRYRASDLALDPIIIHDLSEADTAEVWVGGGVTSERKPEKVNTVTEHIRFADNAVHVGKDAFHGMKALKSLRLSKNMCLPDSPGLFRNCPDLREVIYEGTLDEWQSLGLGKVFGENTDIICKDGKAVYRISGTKERKLIGFTPYGKTLENVPIPENISVIGKEAFRNRTDLTSLLIPRSVIRIDRLAFAGCTGLKELTILSGKITLSDDAFAGCTALETVNFPSGCEGLSGKAFSGCPSLKTAVFGDTVWERPVKKNPVMVPWDGMNRQYYNLFAIKNEDYDTGSFTVYKKNSMVLTDPRLEEELWRLTDENLEWMKTLPCIFTKTNTLVDHSEPEAKAVLGKIDDIIIQDCGIKIKYSLSETVFPHNLLVGHQKELGMEKHRGMFRSRLYFEHWAIIKTDLVRTLETLGINSGEFIKSMREDSRL